MPDAVTSTAVALDDWINAVKAQFPWRARLLRRMVRSPFWLRCLLRKLARA